VLRTATFAAALVLSATTVSAQAPATATTSKAAATTGTIKPGTYDIELAIGGGVLQGTLEITTVGDSLGARIAVGDHNPPPVRKIKRAGSNLTIEAGDTGVSVNYDLTFDGDAVGGKFTFNGDPGLVTGKRRK
jgi:hypothetical protein